MEVALARKHEAAQLLKGGLPPSKIAQTMGVSISTVVNYLLNQIGEGRIGRYDIVLSIPKEIRDGIEAILEDRGPLQWNAVSRHLLKAGIDYNIPDLRLYLHFRESRISMGDLYEFIREIEIGLHQFIKDTLIECYGIADWWRKGIPPKMRGELATQNETDSDPADEPFCYTTFINIKEILDKGWKDFEKALLPMVAPSKKTLLDDLVRLNSVRNCVMHPVRGSFIHQTDFELALGYRDRLLRAGLLAPKRALRYLL
jgi:hypothetical protein